MADIRPTAELVGHNPAYRKGAEYVTALEKLPLGRVVNDKKVEDHHAIIPTKSEHDLGRMGADELKVYDLVAKRFLAIFHPDAVFERTRVETTVAEHVFRTSGRRLVVAGWKAVYGDEVSPEGGEDDSGGDQSLPKLDQGETVETRSVESLRKETQPPRRFTEASLLAAMEGAGKDIEDDELREAMKESGIGTPATRAATIELLLVPRVHRARGPRPARHREGDPGDPPAGPAPAHLGRADRRLGAAPRADRARRGLAAGLHEGHRQVHHRHGGRAGQAQGRADRAGEARAVRGVRARDRGEPQGLLVLVARGPGLRLRDLEAQGGQVAAGVGGEGADRVAARVARGRARTPASGGRRSP